MLENVVVKEFNRLDIWFKLCEVCVEVNEFDIFMMYYVVI